MKATNILSLALDSVAAAFTPEVAKRIIELKVDVAAQLRIDELAAKANQGSLSAEEAAEYQSCVTAIDFVSILQAKSQRLLDSTFLS